MCELNYLSHVVVYFITLIMPILIVTRIQVSRDIPLMMADILYTVICSIELWNYYAKAKSHGQSLNNALFQRNQLTVFGWLTAIIYIALLFILCKTIQ